MGEVELDELPKAAGVVVVHRLGVPKRLHDGTAEGGSDTFRLPVPFCIMHTHPQ